MLTGSDCKQQTSRQAMVIDESFGRGQKNGWFTNKLKKHLRSTKYEKNTSL